MLGFIGGSGIYESLPLNDTREVAVTTPFGDPSAPLVVGEFADTGREVAFVPRHGRHHQYSPTNLPYRANIYALKELGVTHVISSNAVGSLRAELSPQTLVVPDQTYDRTKRRPLTFFDEGIVVHQPFAEPYCRELSAHLAEAARDAAGTDVVEGGTYVCIEGPQFSTVAESEFYRAQGWDVVGMTTIPEAKLAREAEMAYATITGVTDYDVWKEDSQVTLEEVLKNAQANEDAIKKTVERAIETLPDGHRCDCHTALDGTINTPSSAVSEATKERLDPLVGDYL
ncbi:S-methyl-5'-thioadenosine phosphorylase [Salinigranum halophilum]|jgi:5'-methylthioadenosine phosphorylase|uniref:S-methyl-5'-thioadenosine phosphorylase n=1 Tax=Salinigranum halophilum TaxID=2565931 RepID=UPI0010A77E9A|nr:S-methyl-5'-thioadenosine phosphorylase [Salinigranum halophilum]